ncbi:MAG: sensor histidine kinase [Cellulosilyticaceae bacterium]
MSTLKKRILCGIMLILSISYLNIYLLRLPIAMNDLRCLWGIEAIIGVCLVTYYILLKGEMQKLMKDLSNLIGQLIGGHKEEVFLPLKDEMPSKLQVEVTRLSEILVRQRKEVVAEKEGIESLLGDIAHQLKTPLTNVAMYTEILEDETLDKESFHMFYSGLRGEVDKLHFLMETLIKMSRLEGGVIKLHPIEADLQDTCLSAIKAIHMKAEQKAIQIHFQGEEGIRTKHDAKWTSEVITNILDNAVKYSEAATCIMMTIIPYEIFVRIDIEDEGRGIFEEEMTHIFKRFYRGEEVHEVEGVGIGLYLARKIVTDQGGYIKVKSEVGKGSIFSVFLPIK